MSTEKKLLITISSKSPNKILIECISALYKNLYDENPNTKIIIIDSDSDNLDTYNIIKKDFHLIDIIFCKNKHYEHGAWNYAYTIYPDYDNYMCIQDSCILNKPIDLNIIDNNNAYTFHNNTGYNKHLCIKGCGIKLLTDSGLKYHDIINTDFILAQHTSFIVNNSTIKDLVSTFIHFPINKEGSNSTERNFGLYFILKGIKTHDLHTYFTKLNLNRK